MMKKIKTLSLRAQWYEAWQSQIPLHPPKSPFFPLYKRGKKGDWERGGLLLAVCCLLLLFSCTKKDSDELPPIPPDLPPATIQAEEKKEEPPKYLYPFSRKREPFYPLVGLAGGSGDLTNPFADSEINPDQTFFGLELRGILRDRSGKIALIRSQEGETYSLKAGKIYDRRNRIISGVSGIIKDASVVLISKNKTVKELPLLKGSGTSGTTATEQTAEVSSPR